MESYLKLDKQICFKFYKISRGIIREYKPLLKKIDLTYPQYLAMLVMWEEKEIFFSELSKKLELKTGTLSPMLKKLEDKELIRKKTLNSDTRKILIEITEKGIKLRERAEKIPEEIIKKIGITRKELEGIEKMLEVVERIGKKEG